MWTLTGKAAPPEVKHSAKTPTSQQQQQRPGSSQRQSLGAAEGTIPLAGFDTSCTALDYILLAAPHYLGKQPSLSNFSINLWYLALLDTVGVDREIAGRDVALMLVEVRTCSLGS
jgi:hypothetical protein